MNAAEWISWLVTCAVLVLLGVSVGLAVAERREHGCWPCWMYGGHRFGGVNGGRAVCRRCGRGVQVFTSDERWAAEAENQKGPGEA